MTLAQAALVGAVALPFAFALVVALARRAPRARDALAILAPLAALACVAALLPFEGADARVETGVPGVAFALRADPLALLFAITAAPLWLATAVFAVGYLDAKAEHARARFHASVALVLGATLGVAFAANLATLVAFYEIISLAAWPLVAHEGTPDAHAAGRRYLLYTLGGGTLVLAGVALAYGSGAGLAFVPGGNATLGAIDPARAGAVGLLLAAGFGVKATLVPLHGWLPSAMVAPPPVSGLLHAVAVVTAGVFGLLRLFGDYLGPSLPAGEAARVVVLALGATSMIVASLVAIRQDNLKLRLAYSTVAQLGYVSVGAALLAPAALAGSAFHIAAHAWAKLALFFVAGILAAEAGITRVSQMDGAARRFPWTMAAFTLAALALVGLPPLPPSESKRLLLEGAWGADAWLLVATIALSTLLAVAYLAPILARAWLRPATGAAREARLAMLAPLLAVVAGLVVLALVAGSPHLPFDLAQRFAGSVVP